MAATQLPEYTLPELAEHATRKSCWVALHGAVYDFTNFVDHHPGGARGLLRYAGTDASEAFAELHSQSIFAAFAPDYLIGRLSAATVDTGGGWQGVPPSPRGNVGLSPERGLAAVSPTADVLPSAFPHDAFTGSGIESFRFHWAVADRLLRKESSADGAPSVGPSPTLPGASGRLHRQKSNLGVLDHDRDWLHVGAPAVYAAEMRLRRELIMQHTPKVYVTDHSRRSLAAEQETLDMVLSWVCRRYPSRFSVSATTVSTLTPGYQHTFTIADWRATQPLRLAGMLVQEDFYLLEEVDAAEEHGPMPGQDDFTRPNIAVSRRHHGSSGIAAHADGHADKTDAAVAAAYDRENHMEDHPSGRQHVFVSACSCFSFDAVPRHGKPMSAIHHPNVPGWMFHLQRGMNRLFSSLTPARSYYRHTQDLQFSGFPNHVLAQEPERPLEAFTGPFSELVYGPSPEQLEAAAETAAAGAAATEQERRQGNGVSSGVSSGRRVKRAFPTSWERLAAADDPDAFIRGSMLFSLEFQTLRRLPHTNFVLFTVRRYVDPMSKLVAWPAAAAALSAAIRRKYKGTLARSGLGQRLNAEPILAFCDGVARRGGLQPGLRGVVPEPWDRVALVDGTSAPERDAEIRRAAL